MADAGGLQLLPESRKKIEYHAPGHNKLLVLSVIFVAIIFAIYGGLIFYRNSVKAKLDAIDDSLVKNEQARSKADENKLLNLKDNLTTAMGLLNNHLPWSEALARIQSLVIPQVQFDNLDVKFDQKQYSFKAYAASYSAVAKQIAAFYSDDAITDIMVGKITSDPDGRVEFTIQLGFDPAKAVKKITVNK